MAALASVRVLSAQETQEVQLESAFSGRYCITDRSDLSRYDNGKYTGHVYREVRCSIESEPGNVYRGNFFVLEETLRDMRNSAQSVDAVVPVEFVLRSTGTMNIKNDKGFPVLRGFPAYPIEPVIPGDRWKANGEKAADPLNTGAFTLVPIIAEFTYLGEEVYKGIPVHHIISKYAVRYKSAGGYDSPSGFSQLQGTHDVDILLRAEDGLPLLTRDRLDETYTFPDGSTVRFKGFTLSFGGGSAPMDKPAMTAALRDKLDGSGGTSGTGGSIGTDVGGGADGGSGADGSGIEVTETGEGVKLTVKNLRFAADSAKLLPEERARLDTLAAALKDAGDRTFLVEGHTASVGRPKDEMNLSVERAKSIISEMVKRGISEDHFIYKGWGATKPAAGNDSEAQKQLNRRVEITILE